MEDLNNILNSGDVPNIYSLDELDQIYSTMKPVVQEAGLPPTKTNLFAFYTKRVRNNLHTVICMRYVLFKIGESKWEICIKLVFFIIKTVRLGRYSELV